MARLIDADALKEQIESHVVSMSVCLNMGEHYGKVTMREDCLEDVQNAPTIDAIPVEWLNQKYAENEPGEDKDYDHFLWDAIAYILTEWQKEQEAR